MPSTRMTGVCRWIGLVVVIGVIAGPAAGQPAVVDGPSVTTACPVSTDSTRTVAGQSTTSTNSSFVPPTANGTVPLGRVAAVTFSIPDNESATVTVGASPDAVLEVSDDGNGTVTLLINSYVGTRKSPASSDVYSVRGDDSVRVLDWNSSQFTPGSYPIRVSVDGDEVATRQLTLTDPPNRTLSIYRGTPRSFDAPNVSAIRRLKRADEIQRYDDGPIVDGETAILRIDAPDLFGAFAAADGTTSEQVASVAEDQMALWRWCFYIDFEEAVEDGALRAVPDARNGTVYLLIDTDNFDQNAWDQTVSVDLRGALPDTPWEVERSIRVDDDPIDLHWPVGSPRQLLAGDTTTVAGRTEMLPGSEIPIRLQSRLDPEFDRRTTATVDRNGTFSATIPMDGASKPGLFELTVGERRYTAQTGDPPDIHWKSSPASHYGDVSLSLENISLPDEAVIVAYQYDRYGNGTYHPRSAGRPPDLSLGFTATDDIEYVLLVVHEDRDGDGTLDRRREPPYRVDGKIVREWIPVQDDGELPETTPSEPFRPSSVATPKSTPSPTPTLSATPTPTTADGPGVGPLGVLVAVALTALLAVRRR